MAIEFVKFRSFERNTLSGFLTIKLRNHKKRKLIDESSHNRKDTTENKKYFAVGVLEGST